MDDAAPVILITEPKGDARRRFAKIRQRYGPSYSILVATTVAQGIAELDRLADEDHEVALVLATVPRTDVTCCATRGRVTRRRDADVARIQR